MPQPIKPAALLTLEKGKLYSLQAKRVEMEPKAREELRPRCPQRFTKAEKKEWRYFAAILRNYGLFTAANGPLLELLAVNSVQYKECSKVVSEKGIIVKGPKKQPMYNPFFNAANKLEEKIIKCLSDLGLSSTGLAKLGSLMVKSRQTQDEFFGE